MVPSLVDGTVAYTLLLLSRRLRSITDYPPGPSGQRCRRDDEAPTGCCVVKWNGSVSKQARMTIITHWADPSSAGYRCVNCNLPGCDVGLQSPLEIAREREDAGSAKTPFDWVSPIG